MRTACQGERHYRAGLLRAVAIFFLPGLVVLACSCASTGRASFEPGPTPSFQLGLASWYGPDFHGKPTSSGEVFDMNDLTAAHNTLPFGTYVMVTNLENNRTAVVRINDRGPFVKGRIIDLSYAAARVLGIVAPGVVRVRLDVISGRVSAGYGHVAPGQPWIVQVGAFSVQENAFKLKRRLEEKYPNVTVSVFRTNLATYYRVRLKASGREEAEALGRRLAADGYRAVLITE